MSTRFFLLFLLLCTAFSHAENAAVKKKNYPLKHDPIDVVIPAHPKDKETIDFCIKGIKENCSQIRRIIVVSSERLTHLAEWYDEKNFPFTKQDVALAIGRGDPNTAATFFARGDKRNEGWYYQQLLKLYCYTIPNLSSNVLLLDSDTVFLRKVKFLNEKAGGLFATNSLTAFQMYINHAKRLVPGYKRIYPDKYSVCHHMLFQKSILKCLFKTVEDHHQKAFWKAFCECVDLNEGGASEYEIYFNYANRNCSQVAIRELKWKNTPHINKLAEYRKEGYHFVSCHAYLRDLLKQQTNKKRGL